MSYQSARQWLSRGVSKGLLSVLDFETAQLHVKWRIADELLNSEFQKALARSDFEAIRQAVRQIHVADEPD